MLHLYFSNQTEQIFEKFAEDFNSHWKDPFSPPLLTVPNDKIEKWLKLQFSDRNGCVAAFQTKFLETHLWKMLQPDDNTKILNGEILQQFILPLLDPVVLEDNVFEPLRSYLEESNESGDFNITKKIQISIRLAQIFLEYAYNRPAVFLNDATKPTPGFSEAWLNDKDYFASESCPITTRDMVSKNEKWQRAIYNKLFSDSGSITLHNKKADFENNDFENNNTNKTEDKKKIYKYLSLPQLYSKQKTSKKSDKILSTLSQRQSSLFVFGLTGTSHFHRNLLLDLANSIDIYTYMLNPCSAFWEDVNTKKGNWRKSFSNNNNAIKRFSDEYDQEELPEHLSIQQSGLNLDNSEEVKDNRLLELWGHTGKESIALWSQASEYNFHFEEVEANYDTSKLTVLTAVQNTILERQSELDDDIRLAKQDDSILILEAQEVVREVETMRAMILKNLAEDKSLDLSDIIICTPNIDKYKTAIHQVFGIYNSNDPAYIPYTIADEDSGQSLYTKAIESFFSLITGYFSRLDVFTFLRNPLVLSALGVDRQEIKIWEQWTDQLNIYNGFDKTHRGELGSTQPLESHTWIHGIRRLIYGNFADSEFTFSNNSIYSDDDFTINEEQYDKYVSPYKDFESDDSRLDKFSSAIEQLFIDIKTIKSQANNPKFSFKEQAENLGAILNQWINIDSDYAKESFSRKNFYNSLNNLDASDSLSRKSVSIEELIEYLKFTLDQELPGNTRSLSGSLGVFGFNQISILPHKITYVLGFNGDDFPGQANTSMFDLLSSRRIIGDLNTTKQNQYRFLEVLNSTREKLIISYLAHNIQKDEELSPSSSLIELESFIKNSILAKGVEFKHYKIPLLGHDPQLFGDIKPDYNNIYFGKDFLENYSYESALLHETKKKIIEEKINIEKRTNSERKTNADVNSLGIQKINIAAMESYLQNPFEFNITRGLGLWDSDNEEVINKEYYDLEFDQLDKWIIRNEMMKIALDECSSNYNNLITSDITKKCHLRWKHYFNEKYSIGDMPEGVFNDFIIEKAIEEFSLDDFIAEFKSWSDNNKNNDSQFFTNLKLTNADEKSNDLESLNILFEGEMNSVWVGSDDNDIINVNVFNVHASTDVIKFSRETKSKAAKLTSAKFDKLIRYWLWALAYSSINGKAVKLQLGLYQNGDNFQSIDFNISSPNKAKEYLSSLFEFMIIQKHTPFLPLAALAEKALNKPSLNEFLEYLEEQKSADFSSKDYIKKEATKLADLEYPSELEYNIMTSKFYFPFFERSI